MHPFSVQAKARGYPAIGEAPRLSLEPLAPSPGERKLFSN